MFKSQLEIILYTPQELNQSSYFRTGLFELVHQKKIKCKVVLDTNEKRGRISTEHGEILHSNHPYPKASYYKLIDSKNNRTILFAIDAYDIAHYFPEYALRHCDFIFKRHYDEQYLSVLNPDTRKKIYPLGLSFMVRSSNEYGSTAMFWAIMVGNLKLIQRDRTMFKRGLETFRNNYRHWKNIRRTRILEEFNGYSTIHEPFAIFQTRCFPATEEQDVQNIHEQRADLIRVLKNKLGEQFKGGFIPDTVSQQYYPDCLTNMPTDPRGYLQLVKRASIGVYTRGLAHSPAWKLAEYLSQGKCIVAEPLTTELPAPLEHGKHLMYFQSNEECTDICEMLLNNPKKMQELSMNARAYYEKYVDPVANVERMLRLMLKSKRHS